MPVTSTTLAGVAVWQFSGAVTDNEVKTAWASLIVNQRYRPGRTIYIDNTCDLRNVRGTYHVDSENLGVILHLSRNKANTVFNNWIFNQTVGLTVGSRFNFIRFTNGTTITTSTTDGIDMKGGGMIYAPVGNPGGGDPRFLNEMQFGSLDGTLVTSQAYTEQELEPASIGTIWKGISLQKCAGFPILQGAGGLQRQVLYRCSLNTEGTQRIVRPYYSNSVCYVSSTVRRQGVAVTANLYDTFNSGAAVIMILNNYTDDSWFGAAKTSIAGANWSAGNRFIGGVLKKIKVQPSTLIRTYDSRSTAVSQKATFSETTSDFLAGTDSTISDVNGLAQIVCVGAIATGSSCAITRYNGQKFTLQKFGFKVQVIVPDMTFGDDDLSAFAPIVMTTQNGISRTLATINAANLIGSYSELVEELHVLAINLVGSSSYNAYNDGNLFDFTGTELITNFAIVNIDKNATSKIAYNAITNTLTLKSNVLVGGAILWKNPTGVINTVNGAILQGNIEDLNGDSYIIIQGGSGNFTLWKLPNATPEDDFATGINLGNYGNASIRFLSEAGFKIVVRDNVTGYKQPQEMIKGIFSIGMYFGNQIQLAQSSELIYIKNKIDFLENYNDATLLSKVDAVKNIVEVLENYNDATLVSKVDAVKNKVDGLENYNDATLVSKVDAVKNIVEVLENYNDATLVSKVDAVKSVVNSIKTTVEDKTGYALATNQIELIATTIESHLLDEGDSQKLIEAIVGAIGNTNIDETVLVAAIRADLERTGGKIDSVKSSVQELENYDDSVLQDKVDAVKIKVDGLENFDGSVLVDKVDAITPKLVKMNEGLQLVSNFEPYEGALP